MSILRFYFLGLLDIRYHHQPLPKPPTLKSQSLLAYLVLHRHQPQPRERLVGLFWGDRPERKARSSLSTSLWHIRRCLPAQFHILSDLHTVQFDPQAHLLLDVDEFQSHLPHHDIARLQSAVTLYRGPFLDGFYDDWIINQRYRLDTLFAEALTRLMVAQEAAQDHPAALSTALRLLQHDPLREDAHRLAMRAYCHLGQRNAALEQYRRCQAIVQDDLAAEPMVETTELYHAILQAPSPLAPAPHSFPPPVPAVGPRPLSPPPLGRNPLDPMAPSRLVGRQPELAFLHQCWQDSARGQATFVLISGESGVGKSRLVKEFADRLRWQAIRVLWGRCYQFERLLPYQPLAEALRTIVPALAPAELAAFPAWILVEVARLVPDIIEKRPELEVTPTIRSDQQRTRLFDGLAHFLAQLSAHGPLLIVFEDLHWATESTLQLLHYLARHLAHHPILMVGTLRSEDVGQSPPLQLLQQQFHQQRLAKPLHLSPLSPADVETMVVEMSGAGQAVLPLARRLYQETEGNPFFLIEIVKALFDMGTIRLEHSSRPKLALSQSPERSEGSVQGQSRRAWQGDFARIGQADLPLPTSLSKAIHTRVHRLNQSAQQALRLASVLGRQFDFDLLNAVWGQGQETTLQALDHLLRHRLIDEGIGPMERDYAFTHHKIQEAVYLGLPRRRRQHAHARAGAAIESLYGPQDEDLAGELAFHFEQACQHDKTLTEKAITYLLQAGDRARQLYAHQEAIDYYQRALTLLRKQPEHQRAARTLMKMALTHHTAFDFQQARQAYEQAFALWQPTPDTHPTTPSPPAPHPLRLNWPHPPTTLDPAIGGDLSSGVIVGQLFSGLALLSPQMEVMPDLASSWQVLQDGRKYLFHLRDDVSWSDGTPVTAHDFEYAWKRVLHPATRSPHASLLYDIKGARDFHQGRTSHPHQLGVHALDALTLAVELEQPTGYFPHLLAHDVTYPVPRHVVEAHGHAWTELPHIVTNGPFTLQSCQSGQSMVLIPNPHYHGPFTGNLPQVQLSFLTDPSAQLELYETHRLDILDLLRLPPPDRDRARQRHPDQHLSTPRLHTLYLAFDVARSPFHDPRVRRAFALATDRQTLATVLMKDYFSPATGGLVPPGMPAHSPAIGLPYHPQQARQLLAQAGYPAGRGFPVVHLLTRPDFLPLTQYLQTQWQHNLVVHIKCQVTDHATFFHRLESQPPHTFLMGWQADYPDPDNFLRVAPVPRYTRWHNVAYHRLVHKARRLIDQTDRIKLYRQADSILVQQAAIIPLYYGRRHFLIKPWVTQYPISATGSRFWKDVIIQPH